MEMIVTKENNTVSNTFHSESTEKENHNPYASSPYSIPPPPPKRNIGHIINIAFIAFLIGLSGALAMLYVTKPETGRGLAIVYVTPSVAIPPYTIGLGSQNPHLFTKSFSEALSYNDAGAIATHTDTPEFRKSINDNPNKATFREVCHGGKRCSNDWTYHLNFSGQESTRLKPTELVYYRYVRRFRSQYHSG